jgi:hypothetical protein
VRGAVPGFGEGVVGLNADFAQLAAAIINRFFTLHAY